MSDDVILVPFGPSRPVPPGHQWCMACDGSGEGYDHPSERKVKCEVCQGKGHWNAEDIRIYHEKNPGICRQSCGKRHRAPDMRSRAEREAERKRFAEASKALDRKIKKLLEEAKDAPKVSAEEAAARKVVIDRVLKLDDESLLDETEEERKVRVRKQSDEIGAAFDEIARRFRPEEFGPGKKGRAR